MMIFGHTASSPDDSLEVAAETWTASKFTAPGQSLLVSKLSIAVSGEGSVDGNQALTGTIHDSSGALVGYSATTTVDNLSTGQWLDLKFAAPVALEASGEYYLGVLSGEPSSAALLLTTTAETNLFTDTLATPGAVTPGSAGSGELLIYATYAYPWQPADEDDLYLASLGYGSAQAALADPPDPRTRKRVYATWHGTFLDPQPQGASLGIVQRGGELSGLVGERVRVTVGRHTTTVYIHRETDLDLEDNTQISLSRRAWQALAPLPTDTLLVTVETVPGAD